MLSQSHLRKLADREGYIIRRSRRRLGAENAGQFMVIDARTNGSVLGFRYDATLEDVREFLR
jgi:hypothetical protein